MKLQIIILLFCASTCFGQSDLQKDMDHVFDYIDSMPDTSRIYDLPTKELKSFKDTVMLNSLNYMYWDSLGYMLEEHGYSREAEKCFEITTIINPNYYWGWWVLGDDEHYTHYGIEKKKEYLNKAIEINPDLPDAWWSYGKLYKDINEYEKSIEYHNKALLLEPDPWYIYYEIAETYYSAKKTNLAIEYFEKALKVSPDFFMARIRLGAELNHAGRYQEEIRNYDSAIKYFPDDLDFRLNKSWALYDLGEYEDALEVLDSLKKIDSEFFGLHQAIIKNLHKLNRIEETIILCDSIIENFPRTRDICRAWEVKCDIFIDKGDYENALKCADSSISIRSDESYGYIKKAIIYAILGDRDKVSKFLRKAHYSFNLNRSDLNNECFLPYHNDPEFKALFKSK
jgi:tetratricopeptide (TPR) repeat protein